MALCQVYVEMRDVSCEKYIRSYLNFIKFCLQPDGSFLNYVDKELAFTGQNQEGGLEDSNGRAVCALGYFISHGDKYPDEWTAEAIQIFRKTLHKLSLFQSPRSIAFALKGVCFYNRRYPRPELISLINVLADKLVGYYKQSTDGSWLWFESYLTYDNCVLSEGLLFAYQATGNDEYKMIAKESFDFLLSKIFVEDRIKVISNQGWLHKEKKGLNYGEQPIDVASTVMTLATFYKVFKENDYLLKQKKAFDWFLGHNHLHQILYNPATGGCYDGLEENNINLNQGAESTVCYLMARLSVVNNISQSYNVPKGDFQ